MLSRGGDGKPVSNLLAGKRHRKCFYKRGLLGRTLTPGLHFPGTAAAPIIAHPPYWITCGRFKLLEKKRPREKSWQSRNGRLC